MKHYFHLPIDSKLSLVQPTVDMHPRFLIWWIVIENTSDNSLTLWT